jgi:hypothetical protein
MNKNIVSIAGRGIGLAMGVVVIVVSTIDTITGGSTLTGATAISLLSIGLTGLSIAALQDA